MHDACCFTHALSPGILLWALNLHVTAMQRILQLTEDQKRAILSHRRMYISHMARLSELRKQLLQRLHSESAVELSNGALEARQTCEDQILRQLENCTVEANRQYFHYVGSVGHDVGFFAACGTYSPVQPSQRPSPCIPLHEAPPPQSHLPPSTLFFAPLPFPLFACHSPSFMPRPIRDGVMVNAHAIMYAVT